MILIDSLIDLKKNGNLFTEYGLSLYIQAFGQKILFDTGCSNKFIRNAHNLGIDLTQVTTVFISHPHRDHIGGLKDFLSINSHAKIYINNYFFDDYYSKFIIFHLNGNFKKIFQNYPSRFVIIEKSTNLTKNIFLIMNFNHNHPMPKSNKNLFVKKNHMIEDSFLHEQVLVIDKPDGLVVFSACSHNGILNIIETVRSSFPSKPIKAVVGGLHMLDFPYTFYPENKKTIREISNKLISLNVNKFYVCHCTGRKAYKILKSTLEEKLEWFSVGMRIQV